MRRKVWQELLRVSVPESDRRQSAPEETTTAESTRWTISADHRQDARPIVRDCGIKRLPRVSVNFARAIRCVNARQSFAKIQLYRFIIWGMLVVAAWRLTTEARTLSVFSDASTIVFRGYVNFFQLRIRCAGHGITGARNVFSDPGAVAPKLTFSFSFQMGSFRLGSRHFNNACKLYKKDLGAERLGFK
jgi:hypothetical protein